MLKTLKFKGEHSNHVLARAPALFLNRLTPAQRALSQLQRRVKPPLQEAITDATEAAVSVTPEALVETISFCLERYNP